MTRKLIPDLLPNTQYALQVRAVGPSGVSEWSQRLDFTTIQDTIKPLAPQNPTWVVNGDSFHGEWDGVTVNEEGDTISVTRYEIELVGGGVTKVVAVPPNTGGGKVTYDLSFAGNVALFGSPRPSVTFRVRTVDNKDLKSDWTVPILTATNPPPAPPTAPAVGSVATAGVDAVQLAWTPPADSDVIGYNIYVGSTSGFTPSSSNKIFHGAATRFTYTTTTYTQQFFKIRAVDTFSQESTDLTGNATPISSFTMDNTAPAVPTGLAGTITNNANGIGARANVTWTLSSPPSDLAGFYVRYRRVGDTNYSVVSFQKDDRAGLIELQAAFTNYEFQIKSYDWSNNESAWSSTVTVASPANAAPANVTGLTSTAGRDSIVYTWTPVADQDIKHYEVTFSTSSTFASGNVTFLTGTSPTLTVSGLNPSTTYYARVRAVDLGGLTSAAWSATNTKATTAFPTTPLSDGVVPAAPGTPSVSAGIGNIFVDWNAVTQNASGGVQNDTVTYEIHVSVTSGFTPNAGTKAGETASTFAVLEKTAGGTALAYGTNYYVKLIAKDRDGSSAASPQSTAVSPAKAAAGDVSITPGDIGAPTTAQFNTAVKTYQVEYAVNSSESTAPTTGWSTSTPTRNPGDFIWTRTKVTYQDNTTNTTNPALLTGNTGATGSQGIPGTPGADGISLYTWIKYADTPTTGMSDSPTGKTYMGIAYNKTSATESTTYSDYDWSLIKGADGNQGIQGPPGADGQTTYTWVKYADTIAGAGMSDDPSGKKYIGLAFNKTTATESSTAGDYQWALIQGPQGDQGPQGVPGTPAATIDLTTTAQVLVLPTGASTTTPASATVTGTATNTTITVWEYSVDGGAFSTSVPTGVSRTGNVVTITGGTMTARTITVRMADANGIADTLTVGKALDGATGATGSPGTPGVGISGTTVTYQVHTNGTTAPTGTWLSTIPATSPGQYLWTRTVTSYTSGSPTTAYSVAAHGATGSTGTAGKGISSTAVTYQVHTNGTTAPTGTWQSSPQATSPGQYLWTRTITTYTDSTTTTAYSVAAHGSTGATGTAGADAYTVVLSNEAQVFPGTVTAAIAGSATTQVIAYKGTTQQAATIGAITGQVTGLTTSIQNNGTTTAQVTVTVTTALTQGGTLTIPITVDGKSFTKTFSWSVSFAGQAGATGGTGPTGVSVVSVTPYFQQKTAGQSAPAKPTTSTPPAPWTTTEPAFDITKDLWRTERVEYSSGTVAYTDVQKDSAYEGAKFNLNYTQGKGTDLVVNGFGTMGDNYNFSQFTRNPADAPTGAAASFVSSVGTVTHNVNEFLPVDPSKRLTFSYYIRQTTPGVTDAYCYATLTPFDAYKNQISPQDYMYEPGTLTTLAAPLNPGDTTVTLTSAANWCGSAAKPVGAATHRRSFIFWDYVDPGGKLWPPETLSRNRYLAVYNDGAVVGNVITLNAPWAGVAKPAGTPLSNGSSGSSLIYPTGQANFIPPQVWTRYSGTISGLASNGNAASFTQGWPPGVGYVKVGWLMNRQSGGTTHATSQMAVAGVSLSDAVAAQEVAIAAFENAGKKITHSTSTPGSTPNNVGDTWFQYNMSNQIIGQWRGNGGTSWTPQTIENAVIATLDGGKITANSINAGKLKVGSFDNVLSDPAFVDTASWQLSSGSSIVAGAGTTPGYLRMNVFNTSANHHSGDANYWYTKPGEKFYVSLEYSGETTNTGNTQLGFSFQTSDETGGNVTWPAAGAPVSVPNTATWNTFTGEVTAGANAYRIKLFPFVSAATAGNKVRIRNIKIYRRTGAELIVGGTITAEKMAVGTITAASGIIADAAITTAKIADAAITTAKIDNLAVNSAKIADAAIITAKINDAAITTAKIGDAQITNAKIADLAVTNAKIANATITDAKIADLSVTKLTAGTVGGGFGITMAAGSSILMNGGYIKSNTYTGTSQSSNPSGAGFYLGNDGLRIDTGQIKANALVSDTLTSTNITLGAGGMITSGTSGWVLNESGLTIPNGGISASKLTLQVGQNLVPAIYADFMALKSSYAGKWVIDSGVGIHSINETGGKFGPQKFGMVWQAQANPIRVYFGTSTTDYNVPVEGGKNYIFSAYVYSSYVQNSTLKVKWSNGTIVTVDSKTTNNQDNPATAIRNAGMVTAPAGVTGAVVIWECSTTSAIGGVSIDGIQAEEQTSNSTEPSTFKVSSSTRIDGGQIRTGEIRSTAIAQITESRPMYAEDGVTLIGYDSVTINDPDNRPAWFINTAGAAEFSNLSIKGNVVFGNPNTTVETADPVSFSATATSGNTALLAAVDDSFRLSDIGKAVTGTGIPANTTIVWVDDGTHATMSQAATTTGSRVITIARTKRRVSMASSANYVPGESGWSIRSDGFAEFRDLAAQSIDGQAIRADSLEVSAIKPGNLTANISLSGDLYAEGEMGERVTHGPGGFEVLGAYQVAVTNYSITSNVATFTTATAHGYKVGNKVVITDVDATMTDNNPYVVKDTPTSTTFTIDYVAANKASTAVTGLAQGLDTTNQNTRPLLVTFPTDGTRPNIISGLLNAETLSVTTGTSFSGKISITQDTVAMLESGVTRPIGGPTLSATYESSDMSTGNSPMVEAEGALWNVTKKLTYGGYYGVFLQKRDINTGAFIAEFDLDTPMYFTGTSPTCQGLAYSTTYKKFYFYIFSALGSGVYDLYLYVMGYEQVETYSTQGMNYVFPSQTELIQEYIGVGAPERGAAGWDHVNNRLLTAIPSPSGTTYIQSWNMVTSGGFAGNVTTKNPSIAAPGGSSIVAKGKGLGFLAYGTFDFGTPLYVMRSYNHDSTNGYTRQYVTFTNAGTNPNHYWTGPASDCYGGYWSPSRSQFVGVHKGSTASSSRVFFSGGETYWTNNADLTRTLSVKYALANATSTTANSDARTIAVPKRSKVTVTVPVLKYATANPPTKSVVYSTSLKSTWSGHRKRLEIVSPATTATLDNFQTGVTVTEPSHTFPAGTPAKITNPTGSLIIDSNGELTATKLVLNGDMYALNLPRRMASGTINVSVSNSVSGSTTLTFPSGRFSSAPAVVGVVEGSTGLYVFVSNVTATGCTIGVRRGDGGGNVTNTFTVNWIASQFS